MVLDVFNIVFTGVNNVINWFQEITESMDMYVVIIGVVAFAIFFRLIVTPIFMGRLSAGASDGVNKLRDRWNDKYDS